MSSTALRVGLRTLPICPIMKNANNTFGLMLGWFVVGRRWNSAGVYVQYCIVLCRGDTSYVGMLPKALLNAYIRYITLQYNVD